MATLQALYLQDPAWVWLGLAAMFVSLNLATGSPLTMAPALAAVLVAGLDLAGVRLGPGVEAAVFVVLSVAGLAALMVLNPARERRPPARKKRTIQFGRQDQTRRLVGRVGRTAGEFANGVGRVLIDETEWAAELDEGEGEVEKDVPVRVTRVMGGVRLQVHVLPSGEPSSV